MISASMIAGYVH